MKSIFNIIRTAAGAAGAVIGYLMGSLNGLLVALLALMACDYLSGVLAAIYNKEISSKAGFKGLLKKAAILVVVTLGNIVDARVIGGGGACRNMVICFYICNEGISILENCSRCGVKFPEKLKAILAELTKK